MPTVTSKQVWIKQIPPFCSGNAVEWQSLNRHSHYGIALEAQRSHHPLDGLGAGTQTGLLLRIHRHWQQSFHSSAAHNGRYGEADVANAAIVRQQRTDRQHATLIPQDGFQNRSHGQTYSVVGDALALDDPLG